MDGHTLFGLITLQNVFLVESFIHATPLSLVFESTFGDNLHLILNVDDDSLPITGQWTHMALDGTETIIAIDNNKFKSTSPTDLIIMNFQASDIGFYTCNIQNGTDSGFNDPPIFIKVQGAPSVSSNISELTVTPDGQTVTIPCTYTSASRIVDGMWLHRNTLGQNKFVDLLDTVKYSGCTVTDPSLTILNYNVNDLGDYWCQVDNTRGSSSSWKISLYISSDTTASPSMVHMSSISVDEYTTTHDFISSTNWVDYITGQIDDNSILTTTIPADANTTGQHVLSCEEYNTDRSEYYTQYPSQKVLVGIIVTKNSVQNDVNNHSIQNDVICAYQCLICSTCTGFNFQSTTRKCQLTKSSPNDMFIDTAWNFYF